MRRCDRMDAGALGLQERPQDDFEDSLGLGRKYGGLRFCRHKNSCFLFGLQVLNKMIQFRFLADTADSCTAFARTKVIACSAALQRSLTPLDVASLFGHVALARLLEGKR